jgi:transcriptional regulator with PAS, ATPase and Fis domain
VITARQEQEEITGGALSVPGARGKTSILGTTPAFQQAIALARRVATTSASVMIVGETGTGKELLAQLVHRWSRRVNMPLVPVNCAAIPEQLLESEMFGHRKGSFTGADRDRMGLLEAANGGTLFLDELTEMSLALQAKMLRVVQDGVVRRVGSESTDAVVDVRFIAATNRSLRDAVRDGTLRQDLMYRLQVVRIHVPPLRERREDIALLASHFLLTYAARHDLAGGAPPALTPAASAALIEHSWPGNVRELQNVIEHAVVLSQPGRPIDAVDLPLTDGTWRPQLVEDTPAHFSDDEEAFHTLRERLISEFEVGYLMRLAERAGGNMARAARVAGIDRGTLYRLLDRHGLTRRTEAAGLVTRRPATRPSLAHSAKGGTHQGRQL